MLVSDTGDSFNALAWIAEEIVARIAALHVDVGTVGRSVDGCYFCTGMWGSALK